MTKPRTTALLALTLGCAPSCGGRSVSFDAHGESRGGSAASGSAGSGGTSSSAGSGNRACRVYATRFTTNDTIETTCAFERSTLTLRCDSPAPSTALTSWETIDAVMFDNHPVGRPTHSHYSYAGAGCSFTHDVTYDESGRPVADLATAVPETSCGNHGATYLSWDDFGRPLTGVGDAVGAIECAGQEQRYRYDDENRRVVLASTGGTGTFCNDYVYTYTFDADSLPLTIELTVNGSPRAPVEFVTLETALICR